MIIWVNFKYCIKHVPDGHVGDNENFEQQKINHVAGVFYQQAV